MSGIEYAEVTDLAEKTRIFCSQRQFIRDVILVNNETYLILSEPAAVAEDYMTITGLKAAEIDAKILAKDAKLSALLRKKGVSLLHNELHFSSMVLYTYSLEHLALKDKVRFYYALKGRDGKSGILAATSAEQMGRAVILVPEEADKEFSDFMALWKCPFKRKKILTERDNG